MSLAKQQRLHRSVDHSDSTDRCALQVLNYNARYANALARRFAAVTAASADSRENAVAFMASSMRMVHRQLEHGPAPASLEQLQVCAAAG